MLVYNIYIYRINILFKRVETTWVAPCEMALGHMKARISTEGGGVASHSD